MFSFEISFLNIKKKSHVVLKKTKAVKFLYKNRLIYDSKIQSL